jgi:hypothetical protein
MGSLLNDFARGEVKLWRSNPGYAAQRLLHLPNAERKEEQFELIPIQRVISNRVWNARSAIVVACRGFGKTRMAATLAILKAWLWPGRRVGCLSASFRQAKQIFEEIQKIYSRSPLLQQCTSRAPIISNDACKLDFKSVPGYDPSTIRALPLADGSKIRGARFHTILVDECVHVPEDVFNMVIRPMAATHQDPVRSMRYELEKQEIWANNDYTDAQKMEAIRQLENFVGANQIIMFTSGYYSFSYIYNLYCKYSGRMHGVFDDEAGYDFSDFEDELGLGDSEIVMPEWDKDNPDDYATFQIPFKAIPEGFLDRKGLLEARRDMSRLQFRMEYEAAWIVETGGWFRPADIAACRANKLGLLDHKIELLGTPGKQYVLTIDPARLSDAFAMVLSEFDPHFGMKIVFAEQFFGQEAAGPKMVERILELTRKYNIIRIGMDKGGGGQQIADFLAADRVDGQLPIYDMDNEDYRGLRGRHILQLVDFTSVWIEAAHNNAAHLLERRRMCFPNSRMDGGATDTMLKGYKDVQDTVEKMISQILQIQVSETRLGGRLRFDLPAQGGGYEKHKDLYSAWLIGCDVIYNMLQANSVSTFKMPLLGIITQRDSVGGWF